MYALSVRNYTWYIDVLPILPPRHVNCYISSAQDIIFFAEGIMFYMFRLAILFHLVQYLENFILCFRLHSKKINFKHIAEFMIFSMFWKLSTISHDWIYVRRNQSKNSRSFSVLFVFFGYISIQVIHFATILSIIFMSLPKGHLHRFISFKYQKQYFVLLYLYISFSNSNLVYRRPDVRWNYYYSQVFNLIEPNYNFKKNQSYAIDTYWNKLL